MHINLTFKTVLMRIFLSSNYFNFDVANFFLVDQTFFSKQNFQFKVHYTGRTKNSNSMPEIILDVRASDLYDSVKCESEPDSCCGVFSCWHT